MVRPLKENPMNEIQHLIDGVASPSTSSSRGATGRSETVPTPSGRELTRATSTNSVAATTHARIARPRAFNARIASPRDDTGA